MCDVWEDNYVSARGLDSVDTMRLHGDIFRKVAGTDRFLLGGLAEENSPGGSTNVTRSVSNS